MKMDTLEKPWALSGGCCSTLQCWWSGVGWRGGSLRTQIIVSGLQQDCFFAVWLSFPFGSVRRLVGGSPADCRVIPVPPWWLCCVGSEVTSQELPKEPFFHCCLEFFWVWREGEEIKEECMSEYIPVQLRHTDWAGIDGYELHLSISL